MNIHYTTPSPETQSHLNEDTICCTSMLKSTDHLQWVFYMRCVLTGSLVATYFFLLATIEMVCIVRLSTISKILRGNNSSLQNGCWALTFLTVEQLCRGRDRCLSTAGSFAITVSLFWKLLWFRRELPHYCSSLSPDSYCSVSRAQLKACFRHAFMSSRRLEERLRAPGWGRELATGQAN